MKQINLILLIFSMCLVGLGEETIQRTISVALGLASHPVNGGDCLISDGTFQLLPAARHYRKVFTLRKKVARATLYGSALGATEFNGSAAGS